MASRQLKTHSGLLRRQQKQILLLLTLAYESFIAARVCR